MMSDTRSRCWRVDSMRRSAARFFVLYFVMPAASSMRPRRSSGRDETMKPLGPTIEVMGSGKVSDVLSTNDLKPQISMRLIFTESPPNSAGGSRSGVSNDVTIRETYRHRTRCLNYHLGAVLVNHGPRVVSE